MAEITRDEIVEIIKANVKVDATGLAPAVISHFMFGFNDAADAILARLGDGWMPIESAPRVRREMVQEFGLSTRISIKA